MDLLKDLLKIAKSVQRTADAYFPPPAEITPTDKYSVIPQFLFKSTRGYLEKIAFQINTSFEHTCYDASAVMIRRLIEILIIETYEHHGIADRIKDSNGEFLRLENLVNRILSESAWNLNRNTKRCLKKVKQLGDLSAHSRRYNTTRPDLDKVIVDLRITTEELLYLAGLRA
jgi:hypothetical protein